mmetsp:Transcript_31658/g.65542  ORF Transcript_31658/g.65542 Transcript_31658/m.65542 type:complete len:136 (-) Transcript_31658:450-857(-)
MIFFTTLGLKVIFNFYLSFRNGLTSNNMPLKDISIVVLMKLRLYFSASIPPVLSIEAILDIDSSTELTITTTINIMKTRSHLPPHPQTVLENSKRQKIIYPLPRPTNQSKRPFNPPPKQRPTITEKRSTYSSTWP